MKFTFVSDLEDGGTNRELISIVGCYQYLHIKLIVIMAQNEQTSPKMAAIAAKALSNPNTSKLTKSLTGALLTQAPDRKGKK